MNRPPAPSPSPQAGNWKAGAAAARQQAGAWWAQRTPRERRLLRAGALVLSVALLWLAGLKPALDTISRQHDQLPRLRAEAARIDAMILEAQALQRRQSGRTSTADMPQALQATLRRSGLEAAASLQPAGGAGSAATQWEIRLADASATHAMEWLAALPHLLHVRVTQVELSRSRIDGRDRPGQVSGHVILQTSQETRR